jgi:hypothetical protein
MPKCCASCASVQPPWLTRCRFPTHFACSADFLCVLRSRGWLRPLHALHWLQGAQYLNLPLSVFNDFDPEDTGEINLYQLFLMLTLFCVGLPEDKAALWWVGYPSPPQTPPPLPPAVSLFRQFSMHFTRNPATSLWRMLPYEVNPFIANSALCVAGVTPPAFTCTTSTGRGIS